MSIRVDSDVDVQFFNGHRLFKMLMLDSCLCQEFNDFLARCLEKKPEDRPTSRTLLRVSISDFFSIHEHLEISKHRMWTRRETSVLHGFVELLVLSDG